MFTMLATSISDFRLTFVYQMDVCAISIESRDGVSSSNSGQDHGIEKYSWKGMKPLLPPQLNYRVIRGQARLTTFG